MARSIITADSSRAVVLAAEENDRVLDEKYYLQSLTVYTQFAHLLSVQAPNVNRLSAAVTDKTLDCHCYRSIAASEPYVHTSVSVCTHALTLNTRAALVRGSLAKSNKACRNIATFLSNNQ